MTSAGLDDNTIRLFFWQRTHHMPVSMFAAYAVLLCSRLIGFTWRVIRPKTELNSPRKTNLLFVLLVFFFTEIPPQNQNVWVFLINLLHNQKYSVIQCDGKTNFCLAGGKEKPVSCSQLTDMAGEPRSPTVGSAGTRAHTHTWTLKAKTN